MFSFKSPDRRQISFQSAFLKGGFLAFRLCLTEDVFLLLLGLDCCSLLHSVHQLPPPEQHRQHDCILSLPLADSHAR